MSPNGLAIVQRLWLRGGAGEGKLVTRADRLRQSPQGTKLPPLYGGSLQLRQITELLTFADIVELFSCRAEKQGGGEQIILL